jgi:hypothetical protein
MGVIMRRAFGIVLLFLVAAAFALDVDEEELSELGSQDIDFINYEGPYEVINTIDEIMSIGTALGESIGTEFSDFTVSGKYRIIHAVDPDEPEGLDADIFIPLPTSRVDHIANMRRIISGFLIRAYGYEGADAAVLARFITVYNAVVRGNMEFFTARYKEVVTDHLNAENAGLSRRYDEWPGMSRVVIPLSEEAGPGVLGTVEPRELIDERVTEELRTQEDLGVEQRREIVDLTERVIEEREQALAEREAELEQEQARLAAEREELERRREEEGETAEVTEREAQLEREERELEQERQEIQEEREEIAELTTVVREERERIARDTRALLDEREISGEVRGLEGSLGPVYFLQVRDVDGVILGQLVQINPITGLTINRSTEDAIVSRSYTYLDESLLVIVAQEDGGRLALFDTATLEESARGNDEVFLGSSLSIFGSPAQAYCVVRDQGEYYVGRFDADLSLADRSVIAVNPYTTLAFGGNKLWVQTSDDQVVALSLETMRIAP